MGAPVEEVRLGESIRRENEPPRIRLRPDFEDVSWIDQTGPLRPTKGGGFQAEVEGDHVMRLGPKDGSETPRGVLKDPPIQIRLGSLLHEIV